MTLDVFADFATSEEKEVNGVWKQLSPGAEILVARAGNKKYARALSSLVEQNQRGLDMKNDEADTLSDQIMVEVMAKTILLGWRGDNFKFKKEVLPYSLDNAKLVLGVKDFRTMVSRLASDIDLFRVEAEAAQGKS